MTEDRGSIGVITGAALVATVTAVAAVVMLSHIAKPTASDSRLARVKGTIERAQTMSRASGNAEAYGARAVCPGRSTADLEAIRSDLIRAAVRAGLTPPVLSVTASTGGDDSRIAPVSVSVQAEGRYDAILNLLGQLEKLQPELFVDAVDVTSKAAAIHLRLSGKVFCWTVAR
jgi:type II secretion system (T2SS) protein M